LDLAEVAQVARNTARVAVHMEGAAMARVGASAKYVREAAARGVPMYGITSGFGGMANVVIPREQAEELQNNLPFAHKAGAGKLLPRSDVRAAMLLRANSFMRGVSGVRPELVQRLEIFLNEDVVPEVHEFGSIGASGDLVPLAYIAGALVGSDKTFMVSYKGRRMDCLAALELLELPRLRLAPKEGLAIMNGTAMSLGIAANCFEEARVLFGATIAAHALLLQGLGATNQSFHPFIHRHKPHPGQVWCAQVMLRSLEESALIRNEMNGAHDYRGKDLIQDRYSMRCLPQFLGPVVEGYGTIKRQLEVELNSATDNPLIDAEGETSYHCGNFLGQYVGMAMDQLRHFIGLQAKHLDVQIGLLVAPEFNNGLPACLVGNTDRRCNMGLKALQISGNSIMPILSFLGAPLVDRFPTHAEQFNQNINSQSFGAANLARQSIATYQPYLAIAFLFGVQAVELRTRMVRGSYDAREALSPITIPLYERIYSLFGRRPSVEKPLIWDDPEQELDRYIAAIAAGFLPGGGLDGLLKDSLSFMSALENLPMAASPEAVER
jgi:phenylalanine ammonia-lyase